jgi:hypothetical protein
VGPVITVLTVGLFLMAMELNAVTHAMFSASGMLMLMLPICAFFHVLLTFSRLCGPDQCSG